MVKFFCRLCDVHGDYLNSEIVQADVLLKREKENLLTRSREPSPTQVVQSNTSVPGDQDYHDHDLTFL